MMGEWQAPVLKIEEKGGKGRCLGVILCFARVESEVDR
jgi:hypothetical protein